MGALGFSAGQCGAVLRVLAFLLKLGNVQFEPQHNIDGSIGTRLQHEYELREACALVGVDADQLELALGAAPPSAPRDHPHDDACSAEEECGSEAGSETEGAGAEWARALRDRLLCALYSRLFNWLVSAVNEALKPASVGARRSLAILDVYGLEALAHNGLERLLINYAAERVQAAVTAATLRREQDEYAREGLAWAPLLYADHELYADLLDAVPPHTGIQYVKIRSRLQYAWSQGPESVLGILRDCTARGAGDGVFLQRLQRRRNPRLVVLPPDRFQVVHFGGAVMYSARGIVAKNRDAVCRRCAAALSAAREPLLAALFAPGASAAPPAGYDAAETASHPVVKDAGSPRRPCALSCRQRALVGALVRRLPPAPRLVRCLRADAALRPHRFDAALLRHQIRTQGIMDMAMLRRAGWCESMCARGLLARYGVLRGRDSPAPGPGAGSAPSSPGGAGSSSREDAVRAARALLRSLPIPSAEFAYGRTKVFIRSPRTVWELESLRAARVSSLVCVAQRAWRRYRARTRSRAAAVIARAWTRHRNRERGAEGGGAARAGLVVWRWWCSQARRVYLSSLWSRLPARHRSPACAAWPPCPQPRLLARADGLLRRLHHRWRCHLYRRAFDQTARNRMREKVTASVLFKDRKLNYARSVAHPFVGDYVRLRASAAWRRGPGAGAADRYVVFADVVGKVARSSGRVSRCLAVVSTGALLLLEARSLRLKRRVPAHCVYRLSLSPFADDLLAVHVRAVLTKIIGFIGPIYRTSFHSSPSVVVAPQCGGLESSVEELSQCSVREAADAPGCLFGGEGSWRRRGDVLLRTCHVLELATKLFLVVQNAVGSPPHVNIATEFEANFGQQMVTVAFHALSGGESGARVLRRGSRMDVLL
ncbi:unnamed protein product [Danaus chrysippus]|uniref:(African queen) hypothetical protein n=1 Tax=Danaus chrysippus TaxID=151541 RepID=A0A8J2R472_9NEOP|nr:unnamed protein product [Danaus chrysippus]